MSSTKDGKDEVAGQSLEDLLSQLTLRQEKLVKEGEKRPRVLETVDIAGVAKAIRDGKCKRIITMCGAGISVSAGIPDFRTPGTGLYSKLAAYDLPYPEAIFSIDYFHENPKPFFTLAKELYPGKFEPTVAHMLIKALSDRGLLLRAFTQNIDTLETIAGIPEDKLVYAHGSFSTSHCVSCAEPHSLEFVRDAVFADRVPHCSKCSTGVVKPDIVFFGENLPRRFFDRAEADFPQCDLLIVMGTSLQVQPFASLVDRAPPGVPRLLINKEKVCCKKPASGGGGDLLSLLGLLGGGFDFDNPSNTRDALFLGSCDEGAQKLADLLGFGDEIRSFRPPGTTPAAVAPPATPPATVADAPPAAAPGAVPAVPAPSTAPAPAPATVALPEEKKPAENPAAQGSATAAAATSTVTTAAQKSPAPEEVAPSAATPGEKDIPTPTPSAQSLPTGPVKPEAK